MTDTAECLTEETLALIFSSGQPDEFGRTWPLAVYGRREGREICVQRNVCPTVAAVRSVVQAGENYGLTHVHVSPDCCG